MKIISAMLSYILTFFLILIIFIWSVLNIINTTLLDKEYVLLKIEENHYYEDMYNILIEQIEPYIEQSGLENIEVNQIIELDESKKYINDLITKFFTGEGFEINQEEIAQKINVNLEQELEKKGIELTLEEKDAVNQIVENVADQYETQILYGKYSKYFNEIVQIITKIKKYIDIANKVIVILIIIVLLILLLLNYNQKLKVLKYLGVAELSNGIISIFINVFVKNNIKNIVVLNYAFSNILNNILFDILNKFRTFGIISISVGFIFIFFGATDKIQKSKNK